MRRLLAFALLTALTASSAAAATLSFRSEYRFPTAADIAAGVPADLVAFDFFATTDADIVSVNNVLVRFYPDVELFQVPIPFGSNTMPAPPEFLAINPALAFDSWITTPGITTLLGADLPGNGNSVWGDLSNDGPQTDFRFASLAFPASAFGTFEGRITLNNNGAPQSFPFSARLGFFPEPATILLAGIGVVGLLALRRRQE